MSPEIQDKAQCPQCGTTRLKILPKLDAIDKLHGNSLANRMRARRGDTLYHCIYCRLQFYDPHQLEKSPAHVEPDAIPEAAPAPPATPARQPAPRGGTLFGPATLVRGSISSGEDIRLEGRVDGTVSCLEHSVTIATGAEIKAAVRAAFLDVMGTLQGNSQVANKTTLHAGSRVAGNIRTGDIIIEDGAWLKGSIELVRKQPALPLE